MFEEEVAQAIVDWQLKMNDEGYEGGCICCYLWLILGKFRACLMI